MQTKKILAVFHSVGTNVIYAQEFDDKVALDEYIKNECGAYTYLVFAMRANKEDIITEIK